MSGLQEQAAGALAELGRVLASIESGSFEAFAQAIAKPRRIVLHGLGREGLQMKGLAMRLYHLGLDAHVAGEMTTPPVGPGGLFIASAGPGDFESIRALTAIARAAGAETAIVTAQPGSSLAQAADHVLHIPAQTMADDHGANVSVLPMGSLFEAAMMLAFELLVLRLKTLTGETAESMRARHTNLE